MLATPPPQFCASRDPKHLSLGVSPCVSDNGESKCGTKFCTGLGEPRECGILHTGLSAFRTYPAVNHPAGWRRLQKLSDLRKLGSEFLVPHCREAALDTRQVSRHGPGLCFHSDSPALGLVLYY